MVLGSTWLLDDAQPAYSLDSSQKPKMMKTASFTLLALAALSSASPVAIDERQNSGSGTGPFAPAVCTVLLGSSVAIPNKQSLWAGGGRGKLMPDSET